MTAAESNDHVPFRYALPPTPVAGAAVEIDHVAVTVELRMTGNLDVLTTAPADRTRALAALRTVAKGLMIRGLGSPAPNITATAGHRFTQRHHDFHTPDTVTFTGDCEIAFTQQSTTIRGDATYALTVTAASAHAKDDNARTWFLRHEKELASIGMVLLIAAPITPARLTR